MTITTVFDPPLPTDSREVFSNKAFTLVAALNAWSTQANALAAAVSASEGAAAAAASAAAIDASTAVAEAAAAVAAAAAAAGAATSAMAAFEDFDKRYLGSKSADPTTDNDGGALASGALYFNTAAEPKEMRVWSGAAWAAAYLPATGYVTLNGTETLQGKTLITPKVQHGLAVVGSDTAAQPSVVYVLTAALKLSTWATPQPGQWFAFRDFSGGSASTLGYADKPIEGDAADYELDVVNAMGCCMYVSDALGWRIFKL